MPYYCDACGRECSTYTGDPRMCLGCGGMAEWREECGTCIQTNMGQTGEYPCPECGLPLVHDASPSYPGTVETLQQMYDSEINITLDWFWDAGVDVKIGNDYTGYKYEGTFRDVATAIAELAAKAVEIYPLSTFAKALTIPAKEDRDDA